MSHENKDTIAVLDFGGQYAHLIANRIRRLGVYSEIVDSDINAGELSRFKGIIFSGSPFSVHQEGSPRFDRAILDLKKPILGLCYGHQLISLVLGGKVVRGTVKEYGKAMMTVKKTNPVLKGLSGSEQVWMSHGDTVDSLPDGFEVFGSTDDCRCTAVGNVERQIYGLQFHPEVTDTPSGNIMLSNFLDLCGCERSWNSKNFLDQIAEEIKRICGKRNVFLLVSGGVDSTVAFMLLNKILGNDRVLGLHIDNGLMRYRESEAILDYMKSNGFTNLKIIDASEDFLHALKNVSEPEEKRKIIGNMFITAKEKAFDQLKLNADDWVLAQGTIYPDTIESAGTKHADRIKTHHNRVDIILEMIEKGNLIEPLAQLYKDEVRELGESMGIPKELIWRHPFPGPGLGVRVLCSDGTGTVDSVQDSGAIDKLVNQYGYHAHVLPIKSVGVQGDERSYAHPVVLVGRCDWTLLEELSTRITNAFSSVNRVVYGLNTVDRPSYTLVKAFMTKERLDKLRSVDHIVTEILYKTGEYDGIWQMPVVLLPMLNNMGKECVVLRPIVSQEAMTARFKPLAVETLDQIVKKVTALDLVGDLFFDITHKPPATIEWE
jgi:GMP synthase (glutamine-hydrolysing)